MARRHKIKLVRLAPVRKGSIAVTRETDQQYIDTARAEGIKDKRLGRAPNTYYSTGPYGPFYRRAYKETRALNPLRRQGSFGSKR